MLKDLTEPNCDYTIKVRIIRLWKLPSYQDPNQCYSIEMIMMDEEGTRMQATCINRWFVRFEKFLEEGAFLVIEKPTLAQNLMTFKYVENKHKVSFYFNTSVKKCNDCSIPRYGISLTTFDFILAKTVPDNTTIDVIGIVTKIFDMDTFTASNGKENQRRTIEIEDLEGNSIYLTLWDEYAKQFSEYLFLNSEPINVVVLLQFGRLKWFKEKAYVSNAYKISRLFINDDTDEIREFKKSFMDKFDKEGSSSSLRSGSSIFHDIRHELLVHTEFNKVAEVHAILKIKSVVIVGAITRVHDNAAWYYDACTSCNKKATRKLLKSDKEAGSDKLESKYVFECENDDCDEVVLGVPRYKIPITVQDSTGSIALTLFDREAKKILGKSPNDIVDKFLNGGYKNNMPDEFQVLLDKKFAFKIDISKYNLDNNYQFFTISKLSDNSSIISQLEKNFNIEQIEQSPTSNFDSMPLQSQDPDSVSYTGDNQTPISSANKCIATRPLLSHEHDASNSPNVHLKRNLGAIYDDEYGNHSSTKATPISITNGKEDGKFNLLTPKLEK